MTLATTAPIFAFIIIPLTAILCLYWPNRMYYLRHFDAYLTHILENNKEENTQIQKVKNAIKLLNIAQCIMGISIVSFSAGLFVTNKPGNTVALVTLITSGISYISFLIYEYRTTPTPIPIFR